MKHHVVLSAMALAMPLSGCATFSFAPPSIETTDKLAAMRDTGAGCTPTKFTSGQNIAQVRPNVIGATDLINNYVLTYGCAAAELANGRQVFEVPGFLAAVTGLIGGSLGLNEDAVITAGVAAAVMKSANGYYIPKEKAALVTAALRATLCVKTEAVGIDFFRTSVESQGGTQADDGGDVAAAATKVVQSLIFEQQAREALGTKGFADAQGMKAALDDLRRINAKFTARVVAMNPPADTPEVSISIERQYFEMVGAALYSIHSILGERLSNSGSADTTEIFKELKKLAEESAAATTAQEGAQQTSDQADKALAALDRNAIAPANVTALEIFAERARAQALRLKNKELQPKLQACVLQARV